MTRRSLPPSPPPTWSFTRGEGFIGGATAAAARVSVTQTGVFTTLCDFFFESYEDRTPVLGFARCRRDAGRLAPGASFVRELGRLKWSSPTAWFFLPTCTYIHHVFPSVGGSRRYLRPFPTSADCNRRVPGCARVFRRDLCVFARTLTRNRACSSVPAFAGVRPD